MTEENKLKKIHGLQDVPEVVAYLRRIGAEVRSIRTAVVKEQVGAYWRDTAIIRFDKDGTIKAPPSYAATEQETVLIKQALAAVEFPALKLVPRLENLPPDLAAVDKDDLFEFRDLEGNIIMLQVRKKMRDGGKAYMPWTYWDDNRWRMTEPDGKLPLWGLDGIGNNTTVFVHEGAKAAKAMRTMVEGETITQKKKLAEHPWGEAMKGAAHLGWIGGALSPYRTDWSVLKRLGIKRVYIVSDNDPPGVAAVPPIAYHLHCPTFHVQFTNEWPASFDLADEWPKEMFKELEGVKRYVGPPFRACIHPATWATDLIPNPSGKGKPIPVLRDSFKDIWAYVEEADLFVCVEMPEILRNEQILNKMLAAFSHVESTSKLIVKAYHGRNTKLCYRPDNKGRIVTDKTTSAINLHTPSLIKAEKGDPAPFIEFLQYMFPIEEERKEVERWCATLVARPDIRMEYGLLLVSEKQGVGKTTLCSNILAPLVGVQNCGWPNEKDITESAFNGWMVNKRLLIVSEIYSGHSWKAYNSLKSVITDTEIEVNQKYQRQYLIENWCHILACSNSLRALKMEEDDRRWFYPKVTEVPWGRAKFGALRNWINSGGLGVIKTWAEAFDGYVMRGERAPLTEQKRELIAGSRSEAQTEAVALAEAMQSYEAPVALVMKGVVLAVRTACQGKVFDSDYELRKSMTDAGVKAFDKRVKVGGRMQYVLMNDKLVDLIQKLPDDQKSEAVRKYVKGPGDLTGSEGAL